MIDNSHFAQDDNRQKNEQNQSVLGQSILWRPSDAQVNNTNITAFKNRIEHNYKTTLSNYHDLWRWSIDNTGAFWSEIWDFCGVIGERGDTPLEKDTQMPGAQFFPNGSLSYAENMLKRRDDKAAIIFQNEKQTIRKLSFNDVYNAVSLLSQAFQKTGVQEHDRIAGYLPNMPEAIIGCLAANTLGAIWSSASPDFGVKGVVDRFGQTEPKIMIAVDGYTYNGKVINCLEKIKAIQDSIPSIEKIIIIPFLDNPKPDISQIDKAILYDDYIGEYEPKNIEFKRFSFNHPLFIMFSSGTTGKPKSIIHGQGGTLLQHVKEHQLQCNIQPGDRFFQFTTTGWMMWNWLISGLASGATLLLFDGSPFYPEPKSLWDFADKNDCKLFGTGAKYIDALRNEGFIPKDHVDLNKLEILTSTGSPLVHESFDYIYQHIKSDLHVSSISGGTDIVSCFVLGNPISPVARGEIQGAGLGMGVAVFDDEGSPLGPGAGPGELVCTNPFPSMPTGFWNDPTGEKYKAAYFERFDNIWAHGDWIELTDNHGYIIHGRSDATLNPGGVRIGTAEIYRQVEQVAAVKESLAVGQAWDGDDRVILFVMLNDGFTLNDDVIKDIKTQIRKGASPRHVPSKIIEVSDIPRTKSGKIVELAVRNVIHNRPVKNIDALANPEALELYQDIKQLQS